VNTAIIDLHLIANLKLALFGIRLLIFPNKTMVTVITENKVTGKWAVLDYCGISVSAVVLMKPVKKI
jgi:hypothetical protein